MIEGAIVNVLDFGADPTGNSDSTAAIQAAVDSLTKGTIYFPNGSYSISSTIEIDGVNQISINFVA
jgi:polygalacturonase